MREIRPSGSEGGGAKPIASPYPYRGRDANATLFRFRNGELDQPMLDLFQGNSNVSRFAGF